VFKCLMGRSLLCPTLANTEITLLARVFVIVRTHTTAKRSCGWSRGRISPVRFHRRPVGRAWSWWCVKHNIYYCSGNNILFCTRTSYQYICNWLLSRRGDAVGNQWLLIMFRYRASIGFTSNVATAGPARSRSLVPTLVAELPQEQQKQLPRGATFSGRT
jgi:hypothetical protein